jgi:hypothetical protein
VIEPGVTIEEVTHSIEEGGNVGADGYLIASRLQLDPEPYRLTRANTLDLAMFLEGLGVDDLINT